MDEGSSPAFFEVPDMPFAFKPQHDFDLHIALEVAYPQLERMMAEGRQRGIETRGISDHGSIHSSCFRDPNGYVIELTAKVPGREGADDAGARAVLDRGQVQHHPAGAAARS